MLQQVSARQPRSVIYGFIMLHGLKRFLFKGKLRRATFHVLSWNLQGIQPDLTLLEEEASNIMTGYPPDLICFQNLPFSAEDPEASDFIKLLPLCLQNYYFLQGPVIAHGQAFATLVRKETIYCDNLYAKPTPAEPIHADGKLIGIKTSLQIEKFPRTTLSICNCNVPSDVSLDHILRHQNEKICLIAGMLMLDGQNELLPAIGVLDIRDFRMGAYACPASCAPATPSASRIFYYRAGSRNRDENCSLLGSSWHEPLDYGGMSNMTERGKTLFGATILHVSPQGWDSKP